MHAVVALLTLVPGRVGGSESYARGLLGGFAEGHGPERVTALVNARTRDIPVPVRVARRYPVSESTWVRLAAMTAGLGGAWRGIPEDAHVVHYALTVSIPRTRKPTVLTLHDVQHLDQPRNFSRGERAWRWLAYDRGASRATLVIAPTEFARERAIERLGLDTDRVVAIAHGIDHRRFRPEPRDGDATLELPERYVVYPANDWPHKNHARLLDAMAKVGDPDVELVLTGARYGRLGALPERLHHLGYVPHDAIPALYRRAAGLIFPSLYEGAGVPPLEAMACGCPVAVSRIPPLRELCGDAAAYFDPLDPDAIAAAIDRLLADPPDRDAALAHARGFTWSRAAERHAAAYARAAAVV